MATNFNDLVNRAEKRVERVKGKKTPYVLSGLPDDMPDITIDYPDAIRSMQFEKAGTVPVEFAVEAIGAKAPEGGHGEGGHGEAGHDHGH